MIINFILQRDKQMHFMVCFALSLSCVIILAMSSFSETTIFILSTIYGLLWGIGKEVYDQVREGGSGWSWGDLLADTVGALGAATVGTFLI